VDASTGQVKTTLTISPLNTLQRPEMNESETIEIKKSLAELGEGLNSRVPILNKHAAGELCFGIKNDNTPVGI
jgi:ATP-dependent DNA helicase RecG